MRWNTEEIALMVEQLPHYGHHRVDGQGGDVDTENIIVFPNNGGQQLYLRGFALEQQITRPDDWDVDMVELQDGEDSRGGLNVDDPDTVALYAEIRRELRKKGFDVVPTLDAYF